MGQMCESMDGNCLTNWTILHILSNNEPAPVDEEFPMWILVLIAMQALITFIGLNFLVIFTSVFRKRSLFHRNLVVIATNAALLWFIVMGCRFIISVASLLDWRIVGEWINVRFNNTFLATRSTHIIAKPFVYIELIRVAAGYSSLASVCAIVLERVLATVYFGTYEKTTHPWFTSITIFYVWMFGIVSSITSYGRKFFII
jgi:hypothetical protein